MLTDNIALANASAVDKTFKKISQSGQSSVRLEGTDTVHPRKLDIRHQAVGKTGSTDRRVATFSKVVDDGEGNLVPVTLSVVLSVPRVTAAAAETPDLWAFMLDMFGDSAIRGAFELGES